MPCYQKRRWLSTRSCEYTYTNAYAAKEWKCSIVQQAGMRRRTVIPRFKCCVRIVRCGLKLARDQAA